MQVLHAGLASSHFLCRLLQVLHPVLDLGAGFLVLCGRSGHLRDFFESDMAGTFLCIELSAKEA